MNRTKIEWTDYTWNPVTGCLNDCDYCYALRITERFKKNFPNGFEPTFYPERLNEPSRLKNPAKIFTGSMTDLFGTWVDEYWIRQIYDVVERNPHHIFQILTKAPERIDLVRIYISTIDVLRWPQNLWLGTTVDYSAQMERIDHIRDTHTDGVKFVSFEPLMQDMLGLDLSGIDWVIIGALTGPRKFVPDPEWVERIIREVEQNKIPVFLKKNLGPLFDEFGGRQEFPMVVST